MLISLVKGQTEFDKKIQAEILVASLKKSGYFDAIVIQAEDSFYVEKGDRYRVMDIKVNSEQQPLIQVESLISGTDYFSAQWLDSLFTDISQRYAAEFRLSARIKSDSIQLKKEKKTVIVHLSIENEEKSQIKQLEFVGTKRYSPAFLKRLSGFNLLSGGAVTSRNDLVVLQSKLRRSGFFSQVSEPAFYGEDSVSGVLFTLKEQNPNRFDAMAGYVPRLNGGGDFVGSLEVDLFQLLTEGNRISLRFNRIQPFRTRFFASLQQDYVASSPFSFSGTFQLFQRDSTFQTVDFSGSLRYDWALNSSIKVQLRREAVGAGIISNGTITNGVGYFTGLGFTVDTKNDAIIPTKGYYFSLFTEYGIKENDIDSTLSQFPKKEQKQRLVITTESYHRFLTRSVLVAKVHSLWLFSDFFQDSDLFRIGGAKSFRGYAEEQYAVSASTWLDIEYRFLLDQSSYLFGFYSIGRYSTSSLQVQGFVIPEVKGTLQSFGLGLAYRSRLGLLTFTYAKSPNDALSNAKVHFSITGGL